MGDLRCGLKSELFILDSKMGSKLKLSQNCHQLSLQFISSKIFHREMSLQYLIKKISSTYEMTFLYGMIISFLYDQSKHFFYIL